MTQKRRKEKKTSESDARKRNIPKVTQGKETFQNWRKEKEHSTSDAKMTQEKEIF